MARPKKTVSPKKSPVKSVVSKKSPKKTVSPKKSAVSKKSPKKHVSPAKSAVTKKGATTKSSSAPVKTKRAKKEKDPNAPKRATSGYFFWLKENRARLTKPGMGVTDVAKAAGVEWGTIKDKSKWEKMAANDKKRYEKEAAAYKKK